MEDEPMMNITASDGTVFEAVRENTTLFTHLGRLACYDHVFVHTNAEMDDEERMVGTYIFRQHEAFEEMSEYMFENDYPMVLNKLQVAECDIDAWNNMIAREMESNLEGWLDGEE